MWEIRVNTSFHSRPCASSRGSLTLERPQHFFILFLIHLLYLHIIFTIIG